MSRGNQIVFTVAFGIVTVMAISVVHLLTQMNEAMVARTIRGSNAAGLFLATDETAIAKLTNPDPYPAIIFNLQTPVPISKEDQVGLVFVANGTRARFMTHRFLRRGRLVEPFPASTVDMMKAEAVEMDQIRIIEGPQKGNEGWVRAYCLKYDWRYP
jgi:hypothetical protein